MLTFEQPIEHERRELSSTQSSEVKFLNCQMEKKLKRLAKLLAEASWNLFNVNIGIKEFDNQLIATGEILKATSSDTN